MGKSDRKVEISESKKGERGWESNEEELRERASKRVTVEAVHR